jgi:hypothetical protein
MAQTLPKMVTSKAGDEYAADSPVGQTIISGQKTQAAKAAAAAATQQAFGADSPALIQMASTVEHISMGVETIAAGQQAMLMIMEADARGDALDDANVGAGGTDNTGLSGVADGNGGGGSDDSGADGAAGGLAGLFGIGASIGSFATGLKLMGNPKVALGIANVSLLLLALVGVGVVAVKAFKEVAPDIAESLEVLSDADVDTEKVIQMGKALAVFGGAMAASGVGEAFSSVGNLFGGIADGLSSLFGIDKKDPMADLKAFAKHEFSEAEITQIERNARGLLVFSTAMTASGISDTVGSIANLLTGVVDGLASMFGIEKNDPMADMRLFADHKFTEADVAQISTNAKALIAFSTAMTVVEGLEAVKSVAGIITSVAQGLSSLFPETSDPMVEMRTFANHKFTEADLTQIVLNSKALLAFSSTMGVAKTMGAVGDVSGLFGGIASGLSSLFGLEKKDPMLDMKEFAKHKITQTEVDQITLNATALVAFSKAMALYSASGAAADGLDLLGGMAKGITNFFGGTTGIDYAEIKKFAESGIGEYGPAVTKNAGVLQAFTTAMAGNAKDNVKLEFTNIGANILGAIGSLFGGKSEDKIPYDEITSFAAMPWTDATKTSIVRNAETLHAYTTAIATMSGLKQSDGFWTSIGSTLSGAFSALLGQDTLPIAEIQEFTAIDLDLAKVNNNISAIEAFMNFGTRMKDWTGSDMGGLENLGRNMTAAAQGIYIAMYGGKNTEGDNYELDASMSLSQLEFADMQTAAQGIAVLRTSLTANNPTQALKDASASMDASTGSVTVVNANNNSSQTSSNSNLNQMELGTEHPDQTIKKATWWNPFD